MMLKGFKVVLFESHGNLLSPHISKMLSNVSRYLQDQDLVDVKSQIGATLCLALADDATPDPELGKLGKLLPKFEKLLKCESFKVKSTLLKLIVSVIEVGRVSGEGKDWATRKATAEALGKLAVVERDLLLEFKAGYLKTFENKRFDKVKVVREVMNKMLKNAGDGRYVLGSRNYGAAAGFEASQLRKKPIPANRSTPLESSYATIARKRSPFKSKIYSCNTAIVDDDLKERDENVSDRRINDKNKLSKPKTKRGLFYKSSDEKVNKFGTFRFESRVAPYQEESTKSTEDIHPNHKKCEDLYLICNQLVQIEQQQSSFLDLLDDKSNSFWIICYMHTIQSHEGSIERVSLAIALFCSLTTPCIENQRSNRGGT
ncbi:hypothetical protein UlMin_023418 [Ulmus minor]